MAKLSAKDREKLPDDVFGLPKERRYPMPDKSHLYAAIRFFDKADPKDRKELAKNINRRAKELNVKIVAKCPFMRYLSPEVASYDASKAMVVDAFNMGTLSPIVGGTEVDDTTNDENDAILQQKMADIIDGKIDLQFTDGPDGIPMECFLYEPTSEALALSTTLDPYQLKNKINDIIYQNELDEMNRYMRTPASLSRPQDIVDNQALMLRDDIIQMILDERESEKIGQLCGTIELGDRIANMLYKCRNSDQFKYILASIYQFDKNVFQHTLEAIASKKNETIDMISGLSFQYLRGATDRWATIYTVKDNCGGVICDNKGINNRVLAQLNSIQDKLDMNGDEWVLFEKYYTEVENNIRKKTNAPISSHFGYLLNGPINRVYPILTKIQYVIDKDF